MLEGRGGGRVDGEGGGVSGRVRARGLFIFWSRRLTDKDLGV